MAFVVLLDATALYPNTLRNVLLLAHDRGLYQAKFSDEILEEVRESVLRRYPDANMDRTVSLIREHFGDCLVDNYQGLIPAMTNEPDDRHVSAAGVTCGAQVIVSDNVADFPEDSCAPYNIDVKTADEFLQDLWDLDSEGVLAILREAAAETSRPRMDVESILGTLKSSAPSFVNIVLASGKDQ
jgi:hypothetical protein